MKCNLFTGVATALVTPFRDGKVDYISLRRLAAYQIDRGVDALVVCGTTGESPTLTPLEKLRCVAAVVGEALSCLWYEILTPFAAWILETLAPVFTDAFAAGLELVTARNQKSCIRIF